MRFESVVISDSGKTGLFLPCGKGRFERDVISDSGKTCYFTQDFIGVFKGINPRWQ